MAKNKHILELNELGQSVWYDNLSAAVLNSGELKGLIDLGVSGLTSNPTIFKMAIADASDYDVQLKKLSAEGKSTEEICEELMVQDIARAADLLAPTYKQTGGGDGYASIEVSPFLARDTQKSIEAAKRLWGKLNRPNIMIKIPGTPEGLPAIEHCLDAGINVNITLIFSVAVHEKVMNAYITALEKRVSRREEVKNIASVASFFVSRVDSICEKKLDEFVASGKVKAEDKQKFLGKVGIANSKLAYAKYEETFGLPRFKKLKDKNARVQRPLWASTGTKNPAFSPVMYVEELAGRDTVNTMPPQTLKALMAGAVIQPKLHSGLDDARRIIDSAKGLGVPFDALMVELQDAGVKLFSDSYKELLDSIEKKRKVLG